MAITSVTINSVTQLLGTNKIQINYTIAGSAPETDRANVFLLFSKDYYAQIYRAFNISGDNLNINVGSHILYWERPDLNYGSYEGRVRIMLSYISI